jgi:nitrous oxidase accessory protein NosD
MSNGMRNFVNKLPINRVKTSTIFGLAFVLSMAASAQAATLCVNPHGKSGCYTTISAAVAAANSGDTVTVAAGMYAEEVRIDKPLSLVGEGRENTTIAANGFSNGIYINGFDAPGLAHVVVTGFTVENANFEGILVQNASAVTIWGNLVRGNDQNLQFANAACPGLPPFETNEGEDCGEGVHLMGVDHSIVADNIIEHNAGGILLSDETAPNHDNSIARNLVRDNSFDCGITSASHAAYVKTGTAPRAFGMYHNTISDNESRGNGGAGVGIFAPGPGNVNIQNSVVHNRLIDNGLGGVTIHNHVFLTFPNHPPNPNANDNVIIGNYISGNAADGDTGTTVPTGISILGTTPITGLVISENIVKNEGIDVAFNSASLLDLHLNSLEGKQIGVANLSAGGTVNATENWWGCPDGPGAKGCATIQGSGITYTPWLTNPSEVTQ